MPGIAVVTNPRSRQNRRNPKMAGQLAYLLGDRGEVAQPQDRASLVEAARRFRDRGVDIVAINGGDGTAHVVLSAFMQAWEGAPLPMVALLRGGTMNTIASGIGVRGRPTDLLGALVARYHSGEPMPWVERNLLCVDMQPAQYGFLFGNGIISNFLEVYYEGSEPSPLKAAWVVTQGIVSVAMGGELGKRMMHPLEVEVFAGDQHWPLRPYLTVAAGTVDDIGLRFRPFFEALRHPGHMHLVGIGCSPWEIIKNLPRIRLAMPIEAPHTQGLVTTEFTLKANRPIPYMIDGDFYPGQEELRVKTGPRLRMIVL